MNSRKHMHMVPHPNERQKEACEEMLKHGHKLNNLNMRYITDDNQITIEDKITPLDFQVNQLVAMSLDTCVVLNAFSLMEKKKRKKKGLTRDTYRENS